MPVPLPCHRALLLVVSCALGVCAACRGSSDTAQLSSRLRLATTTSCENSGLLDEILPAFEDSTGVHVEVISVGTGRALRLAENGDVDVVLVHAPAAEEAFVEGGFGVNRRSVMYNEFVLVGPPADPAGVGATNDAVEAFRRIHGTAVEFVSRGDNSGTYSKELALWREAGVTPEPGPSYLETGQGMAATLRVADEIRGYCLTDIATLLTYAGSLSLEIALEGDPRLRNPYHVIAVNPGRHAGVRYLEAMLFIGWLTSPQGSERIGSFERHGRVLFVPHP